MYRGVRRSVSILFLAICLLSACDARHDKLQGGDGERRLSNRQLANLPHKAAPAGRILYFGFDVRASPKEDAKQYLPFLDYLEQQTGYTFKLRFTPSDGDIVRDIGTGVVQFAAIGAVSYIRANQRYGVKPLVRGVNQDGKDRYRSCFVVRPASRLQQVHDIVGQRFAFGSKTSTQGHLIPRIVFRQQGIRLSALKQHAFTGSHINCVNSVLLNEADVCAMQDVMAEEYARRGKVRILYKSDGYPSSGIVANNKVAVQVIKQVKTALLDFDPAARDAARLYHWDKTEMARGFVEAKDEDYAELRRWMGILQLKEFN